MKFADFPAPAAPVAPAAENGTHRAGRKNGSQPKRPVAEPLPAPFAPVEATAIDAPAWPLHSAAWFQQDLAPSAPGWTGLAVERRNSNPPPGFIHGDMATLTRPDRIDEPDDPRTPAACPQIPPSGLDPLGWDPRTVLPKEDSR
jgi:hypothetical protein